MNAVGIDVSKGKSMVAALRPMGEVALLPQEFLHTEVGLEQMAYAIVALGEDTRVIMAVRVVAGDAFLFPFGRERFERQA